MWDSFAELEIADHLETKIEQMGQKFCFSTKPHHHQYDAAKFKFNVISDQRARDGKKVKIVVTGNGSQKADHTGCSRQFKINKTA